MFGALLAPSALSLLTVTFAGTPDWSRAFGIFGAVAGGAGALGLLLGGVLTQVLSWRWCLYVNLAFAVPTALVALRLLVNHSDPDRARIDIPGTLTWTLGLFALVFGFSNAETHGWGATATVVALIASPVLLTAFVLIERRVEHPLMPLHIVWDRARGGSYTALLVTGAGIFGVFLFLTYFIQQNLGFSPLKTGLAFLPLTARAGHHLDDGPDPRGSTHRRQTAGAPRHGARGGRDGSVRPADAHLQLLHRRSAGPAHHRRRDGLHLRPTFSAATLGVAPNEAGIASAHGQHVPTDRRLDRHLAALNDLRHRRRQLPHQPCPRPQASCPAAAVHGDTTAFWWAAGIFGLGFLLTLVILPSRCEARTATTLTALARHAIGNCHHDETAEEAAVTDGAGLPRASLGAVRLPAGDHPFRDGRRSRRRRRSRQASSEFPLDRFGDGIGLTRHTEWAPIA